jgi:hypothetical protein
MPRAYDRLTVSRDDRFALLNTLDHQQTDIMVADGFR